MNMELLGKLLDAGFTRDEIMQLTRTDAPAPEEPKPVEEPEPVDDPKPAEEPKPAEPEPEPSDTDKRLAGIENNISALIKTIQMSNLLNNSHGGNTTSLDDQTDAIMASIIRPETGKESR